MRSTSEPMIIVKNVHKSFVLPHSRAGSLKAKFVSLLSEKQEPVRQKALKGVSFTVNKGDFFGIVGRNGSGKSTLLKMIANIYQPTQGVVDVRGTIMPFIELGVGFNPELTGRENVYLNGALLGKAKKQIDKDYEAIVEFAELHEHMDKKLKNYSSGMQVRLAFACATMTDTDVLVVDEVLAVGDADFQKKCFAYFKKIKDQGKTVILVTHDMSAVKDYCDKAILIEGGKIIEHESIAKVADAYSELFNPNTHSEAAQTRWGDDRATITSVRAKATDAAVSIKVDVRVKQPVEGVLVLAYAVKNMDGFRLFGNKIEQDFGAAAGDTFSFSFSFTADNILIKGKYLVDISIFDPLQQVYLDCWIDCAEFTSTRKGVEGYSIVPADQFEIERR